MSEDEIHFDDDSRPVDVEEIDFDAIDARIAATAAQKAQARPVVKKSPSVDDMPGAMGETIRKAQLEAITRLLQDLCDGNPTDKEIGRRALFRLHELKPEKTQEQLARQIGVSRSRVTQLLTTFKSENN